MYSATIGASSAVEWDVVVISSLGPMINEADFHQEAADDEC